MTTLRNPMVLLPLLLVGSLAAIGWSWSAVADAAAERDRMQADRDEARRLAADFRRLETVTVAAAVTEQSAAEILDRVATAMQRAELTESLERVQPQAQPTRVPQTDYLTLRTKIELSDVTLRDAVRFAQALEDPSQGMVVDELRLIAPAAGIGTAATFAAPAQSAAADAVMVRSMARDAGAGGTERWTADLALTQTIFSPSVAD